MRTSLFMLLASTGLLAAGCGGRPDPDAGPDLVLRADAPQGDDAAVDDAGEDVVDMDAAVDDAGEMDATVADAVGTDTPPPQDVTTGMDAPPPSDSGSALVHGCSMYDDHTRGRARTVTIVENGGVSRYIPRCMRVRVGQTVTFSASDIHPLMGGRAPGVLGSPGDSPNPIPSSRMNVDVTFNAAGRFPFYCTTHYSTGMLGAIEVVP